MNRAKGSIFLTNEKIEEKEEKQGSFFFFGIILFYFVPILLSHKRDFNQNKRLLRS
jgi:hypothetical protein